MIVNPGIRRFLGSAIQRLFNSASFYAPLTHTLALERGTGSPTFTRASTATVTNNDGYLVTALAGEARFEGARRVYNQVSTKSADNTVGSTINSNVTAATTTLTFTAANNAYWYKNSNGNAIVGRKYVCSATVASTVARTVCFRALATSGTNSDVQNVALTTASQRIELTFTADIVGVILFGIENRAAYATDTSTTGVITFTDVQIEDVTAQTTQTAGEYVSVGALDYRSTLNPLYYSTPGTAGHYASTPNSAAHALTGDIDIDFDASSTDWASGQNDQIIGNYDTAAGLSGWRVIKVAANTLRFDFRNATTGSTTTLAGPSTAANIVGNRYRYRFKRVGATYTWYQSTDNGSTWTVVVGPTVGTAGAIVASLYPLILANDNFGTSFMMALSLYSARVYSGDRDAGGTLAVDFNPHRDATTPTGTITSSTTGEVWTLNGASSVIRSAAYHGSMVDGVKCYATDINGSPIPSSTLLGYQAQGARTNLCLQSNAFTTTWTNSPALSTLSQNVIGPDGAVSAWTCADTDAANTSRLYQVITLTAAAYTASLFVKKTSGATSFPVIALVTGTVYGLATLDTNNGVATAWTSNGYGTTLSGVSARCSSFDSDFWRFELTATGTAAAYTYQIYPAGTTNATQSTGVLDAAAQGSAVFYGAQVELGSFASSYIATTTAAVTRNADVLTYSSAGNIDGTKGWCYAEFDVSNDSDGNQNIILGSDVAGVFPLYAQPSLGNVRTLDGTNAPIAQSAPMTGVRKGAGTWGGSTMQSAHNGVVSSTTAFDGNMEVTAVIRIGEDNAGNSHFFGTIKNLYIGQRQLSASELGAITS